MHLTFKYVILCLCLSLSNTITPFFMRILIFLALLSTSAFADKMYYYTYVTKTEKCAVDVFVPTTGRVKVEKICFNLSK